jgi:hypothetical protein
VTLPASKTSPSGKTYTIQITVSSDQNGNPTTPPINFGGPGNYGGFGGFGGWLGFGGGSGEGCGGSGGPSSGSGSSSSNSSSSSSSLSKIVSYAASPVTSLLSEVFGKHH